MAIFLREEEKLESSLKVLEMLTSGSISAIVSVITLVEIATLFSQKQENVKAQKALELIVSLQNTLFVNVTAHSAMVIAGIKVSEKLAIADASILAAALEMSADVFLTFDSDFKKVKQINCMTPDEFLARLH